MQQIAEAITPMMGESGGKVLFALGITSAALIASIVVSLAAVWGVSGLLGLKTSFNLGVIEAPGFYVAYGLGILAAGSFVLLSFQLVEVTILVEIVNTLMLSVILGFLFLLAFRRLPENMRLKKWERVVLSGIYVMISFLNIVTLVNMIIR